MGAVPKNDAWGEESAPPADGSGLNRAGSLRLLAPSLDRPFFVRGVSVFPRRYG